MMRSLPFSQLWTLVILWSFFRLRRWSSRCFNSAGSSSKGSSTVMAEDLEEETEILEDVEEETEDVQAVSRRYFSYKPVWFGIQLRNVRFFVR